MPATQVDSSLNSSLSPSDYGELVSPTTLKIQRTLPGPIERVWSYIADSELRQQWLAAGVLTPRAGATLELVWRNDRLSASASERPAGFAEESRATCQVTEVDPPHTLRFTWPGVGDVSFELEPRGDEVLLTLTHRRLPDRGTSVMVGAGWHMHCDILAARVAGAKAPSFWAGWARLRDDYDGRIPG